MSAFEFTLSAIIVLLAFLAFAMTLTVIMLGSNKTKSEAVRLFQFMVEKLFSRQKN